MSKPKIPSCGDVELGLELIRKTIRDCDEQIARCPEVAEYYTARRRGLDAAYFFLTNERIPEPVEVKSAEGA